MDWYIIASFVLSLCAFLTVAVSSRKVDVLKKQLNSTLDLISTITKRMQESEAYIRSVEQRMVSIKQIENSKNGTTPTKRPAREFSFAKRQYADDR